VVWPNAGVLGMAGNFQFLHSENGDEEEACSSFFLLMSLCIGNDELYMMKQLLFVCFSL
jgi:hypothetical protein